MNREEVLLEIARLSRMEVLEFSLRGGPRIMKELWALIESNGGQELPTTPTKENLCESAERRLETKKVGRPKVYPDRKTQMRELMRRKRAVHRLIKKRP